MRFFFLVLIGAILSWTTPASAWLVQRQAISGSSFPIAAAHGGRYFIDANGNPVQMVGYSLQALSTPPVTGANSWQTVFQILAPLGYNTVQTDALCDTYLNCRADLIDQAGNAPFSVQLPGCGGGQGVCYDLSKPLTSAYWTRLAAIINLAKSFGFVIILNDTDTAGCGAGTDFQLAQNNGVARMATYGTNLANWAAQFSNVILMSGNDYACWHNVADDALFYAAANAMKLAQPSIIQTMEGSYNVTTSTDDTSHNWAPILGGNGVYSYISPYVWMLHAYNSSSIPAFGIEYEYVSATRCGEVTNDNLMRKQALWTATQGGAGVSQLFSDRFTWGFPAGWQNRLGETAAVQYGYAAAFWNTMPWWLLVPDQNEGTSAGFIVAGQGSKTPLTAPNGCGGETNDGYTTGAVTSDGKYGVVYFAKPNGVTAAKTITVNLAKFSSGGIVGEWWDPTKSPAAAGAIQPTAVCTTAAKCANTGTVAFTDRGRNGDGETPQGDWVLLLIAGN